MQILIQKVWGVDSNTQMMQTLPIYRLHLGRQGLGNFFYVCLFWVWGFSGGSVGKEYTCSAGDAGDGGLIPGSGRSRRGGHGNPLQDSCLENPMDRGAWWATVHGVAKSQTQLSDSHTHIPSPLCLKAQRNEKTSKLLNIPKWAKILMFWGFCWFAFS